MCIRDSEMMLLPYKKEPATGSLIPSISTGGSAMNATMKHAAAVSKHGIMSTPNHPTYILLFVDVTHSQNSGQPARRPFCLRVMFEVVISKTIVSRAPRVRCDTYFRKSLHFRIWETTYYTACRSRFKSSCTMGYDPFESFVCVENTTFRYLS